MNIESMHRKKAKEFEEIKRFLLHLETKEEIIKHTLHILRDKANSQTASIFLLSKDGYLERAGLQGQDAQGNQIEDSLFSEERYEVGQVFTGKAAFPHQTTGFGEIQPVDNKIREQIQEDRNKSQYLKILNNAITCALAIPLNGRSRTYGVLELINQIDPESGAVLF